jgi:hypothetical protein
MRRPRTASGYGVFREKHQGEFRCLQIVHIITLLRRHIRVASSFAPLHLSKVSELPVATLNTSAHSSIIQALPSLLHPYQGLRIRHFLDMLDLVAVPAYPTEARLQRHLNTTPPSASARILRPSPTDSASGDQDPNIQATHR